MIKYLATKIVLIKSIGIIYRIFIKWLTTTIIFINLLLLGKSTIKLIKYYAIFISKLVTVKVLFINILSHIVVHYRLIIYLLDYFIYLYTAKISYYKRVIYKFKYLKLQGFGI